MQLASWLFWSTVPRRTSGRRGFVPTWPSHAWLAGSRALVLRDSVWTLTRLGSLGVDGRLQEDASERDPGFCSCQRSWPSSEECARLSRAPQGASARSASTQSARHVVGGEAPQAPERAVQRDKSGTTALRATELLISCREARLLQFSASCVWFARWSCGATISAQQLPWRTDSWETAGSARRAVGFPAWLQAHCRS